ncbi:MAG: GFA family protein [bacterium]|nr:GFA family protein [bacterium]
MDKDEITGRCLCGQVSYQVTGKPLHATICHCANCRRASGAQSVAWLTFSAENFSFSEPPSQYRSETEAIWSFCGRCGTTLAYQHNRRPGEIDLTVGSLDDPEAFPPTQQVSVDEKLSWT